MAVTTATAAPVRFNQVVQLINAKPGKANTGSFSQLRLVNGEIIFNYNKDDKEMKKAIKIKPLRRSRMTA